MPGTRKTKAHTAATTMASSPSRNNNFHTAVNTSTIDRWESPADLNLFVDDLVEQMVGMHILLENTTPLTTSLLQNAEFQTMGDSILGRMNEMGSRLEALEENIASVAVQAGLPVLQQTPATTRIISTPTKSKQQQVVAAPISPTKVEPSSPTKIAVEV